MNPLDSVRAHWKDSRFDCALSEVESLLRINPLASNLHLLRARLLQLQEGAADLTQAEASLHQCLEIEPNDVEAHYELMHLYDIVLPNSKLARKHAEKLRNLCEKINSDAKAVLQDIV